MTQLRERNPVPIGVIGLVVVAAITVLALKAGSIPFLGGGGTTVRAYFAEASNLQKTDDVRMAGIKIGTVSRLKLVTVTEKGAPVEAVEVWMKIDAGTRIDDASTATIRIKTLLGSMYVGLVPGGTAPLTTPIDTLGNPSATPLVVTDAFEQLSGTVSQIDTTQVAQSFNVLSQAFANTPDSVSSTLKGLSAISQTISSRDQALQTLLGHAQGVTAALASRDSEVTRLIDDGNTVLQLANEQRDVIHSLLVNTSTLSRQLTALVAENRAVLKPALVNLQKTLAILSRDQTNLDTGINLLAPFIRDFTNTIGNGEWFDNVVQNFGSLAAPGCFTPAVGASATGAAQGSGSPPVGCL